MVALFSCEAVYLGASLAVCQASWLEMLLDEIGLNGSVIRDNDATVD